ncbi:MAG: TFIIB-type zinc ribbon-containing protein [Candidatus Hodarchaeaceae archaeon]|nr:TFIIB-type zinc ribbon-containing protein [Candidatus Hodarchaeaceae archaeon]
MVPTRCPSCSSSAVLYDHSRGEQVCTRCGLVILERLLEPEPEWRMKPGEEMVGRADVTSGIDVTQHDLGIGSIIGVTMEVSPSWRARLRRMRELQKRSRVRGWEDRSLREALVELDKLCEDLALPKGVKAEASVSYRRARVKGITVGRNLYQVLAAIVFITCRMRGIPRTDGEVSDALVARFGGEKHGVLRNIRKITRLLTQKLKLKLPRITTDDYIDRFAPQLGLSKKAVERAHELHKTLPRRFTQAKPPRFLAAMTLYLAPRLVGERVTLRRVARTLGVGMSSLSKNVARAKKFMAEG